MAVGRRGAEGQQSTSNGISAAARRRRAFSLMTRAQSKFLRFQIEQTGKNRSGGLCPVGRMRRGRRVMVRETKQKMEKKRGAKKGVF